MIRSLAAIALAAALLASNHGAVLAHAMLMPESAMLGEETKVSFTVGHCDGSPTTEVRVSVPPGFVLSDVPELEGWSSETQEGSGLQVLWRGGSISDDSFGEFFIVGRAEQPGKLLFPLTQVCDGGGLVEWAEAPGSVDHPAPVLMVAASGGAVSVGDIEVSGAFTRATLPKAPVGGGYLTITNRGDSDDRLVAASSPAAERVELHEMRMEGEVMKMAEREEGVELPAGEVVALAPGGLHIMFIGLAAPFVEGESVPVTLQFEKAGAVDVDLQVGPVGAAAPMPMTGGDMPHAM